jgi:hypothetical protein
MVRYSEARSRPRAGLFFVRFVPRVTADIRLHEIGAARDREVDVAGRPVFARQQLVRDLEEAALVLFRRREVERRIPVVHPDSKVA